MRNDVYFYQRAESSDWSVASEVVSIENTRRIIYIKYSNI